VDILNFAARGGFARAQSRSLGEIITLALGVQEGVGETALPDCACTDNDMTLSFVAD